MHLYISKPIIYSDIFKKSFRKRISKGSNLYKSAIKRIDLFINDRKNPLLKDHALKGDLSTYRSFSITGGIRIIYKELEDCFIFSDIGTHNQVYE